MNKVMTEKIIDSINALYAHKSNHNLQLQWSTDGGKCWFDSVNAEGTPEEHVNAAIIAVMDDKLLYRVKDTGRYMVKTEQVYLPRASKVTNVPEYNEETGIYTVTVTVKTPNEVDADAYFDFFFNKMNLVQVM